MSHPRFMGYAAAAVAFLSLALVGSAATTPRVASSARATMTAPPRCTANVVHPIRVRVRALDPIARGGNVRLLVTASSRVGLEGAVARMISTGGANAVGPLAVDLGTLSSGRDAEAMFTISVPQQGNRFYVQFQVSGRGPLGTLSRGGCYNILPDGPLETGRLVVTPQGERVLEFGARRIP